MAQFEIHSKWSVSKLILQSEERDLAFQIADAKC